MNLFFTTDIRGDFAWFSEEESRHVLQVLRKMEGDPVQFVDGKGGFFTGIIHEVGKRHFTAKINSAQLEFGKRNFRLHLAVAPVKNAERFEWFLEKATEIGVDQITPLRCEHSERTHLRLDRLEKIVLAATKQSLRAYLPKLDEMTDFEHFVKNSGSTSVTNPQSPIPNHFIAHCQKTELPHLKNLCPAGQNVLILIGPEGDFSPAEIDLAERHGFVSVSLGKARLRTETAGVVACHLANLANEF
ncbi:MAG: 16S rRNA (uracil(1498)-N(3))-methyltransferase [Bacteroidota bacterium]